MHMRKIYISLAVLLCYYSISFATDKDIVISTYHPSPFGSYDSIKVHKLNVGESAMHNNSDDATIAFSPRVAAPPGNIPGSIYYNSALLMFFYNDGTRWYANPGVAMKVYTPDLWSGCPYGMTLINVMDQTGRLVNWLAPPPGGGWLLCD
ncbi:MAG: hypothetical protein WDL87_06015 [Candidatus Omnitrophota bacterium]|jgi:hypothetical protein